MFHLVLNKEKSVLIKTLQNPKVFNFERKKKQKILFNNFNLKF